MRDYAKGICPHCNREFELMVKKRNIQGGNYVEMTHFQSCKLTIEEAVLISNNGRKEEGDESKR